MFTLTQCNENLEAPKESKIEITDISNGLKAFIGKGEMSMENVSAYFSYQHNVDFMTEYQKISEKFTKQDIHGYHVGRVNEIDLYNFQSILDGSGISYGSHSYDYLATLSGIFENGVYEEWEIHDQLNQMRNDILGNYSIPAYEKNNLLATWDALLANYEGLVQVSYSIFSEQGYPVARTQGWFRNAWRIVRSVILTAGVGALVGSPLGLPGAVVGAIVMGAVAITDAWANDYCHFAMQCDGGWRQECSTGECSPYAVI
ncbi:MAG: hypothetical protein EBR30_07320 [Cytophagia bacterium]|nr:hypothetical protein [Cytophagia bacterium]